MFDNLKHWENEVDAAAKHAVNVYNDEVAVLSREEDREFKKDAREIKHVEHQLELDGWFVEHHLDYLMNVLNREVEHIGRINNDIVKAEEDGNEKRVERLNKKLERALAASDKHIEMVADNVAKHLEKDAKAAAHHIVVGAHKLAANHEEFEEELNKAADKVVEAVNRFVSKVDEIK